MSSQPIIIDPGSTIIAPPSARGPLVRAAKVKWERDSSISDLIDYFDEPRFHDRKIKSDGDRFALLTVREIQAIEDITRKCRNDFSYASRNFFWITNKKKGDQLFKLWESQELIYEQLLRLKSKGLHMKLMILKARQLGALDPESRVLKANLTWDKIDNLKVGDEIISVDEHVPGGKGGGRKMRTATVLDKWEVTKEAFKITFEDDTTITATGDHPFLCKKRGSVSYEWKKVAERERYKHASSKLSPGDEIRVFAEPWEIATTFEDGWFAGLLDGEGSYRNKDNGSIEVCVCQVEGAVLDRAKAYLDNRGVQYRIEVDDRDPGLTSKLGDKPVHKLVVSGGAAIRLVGMLRPSRLVGKRVWEGKELPNYGEANCKRVKSVESIGVRRMVDIRTTTATFFGEGLVTHNCSTLIEGLIAWASMFFRNVNAIVVSFDAEHAAYLFGIMQHIFDMMPWWLKPQCSSREYKDGLKFDNPDQAERRRNPGLNSAVMVQAANKRTGVGQGVRISAAHLCFAPGTSVIVHDGYVRDIESVKAGDGAMDCNGELTSVRGVHKSSRQNETTAEVSLWGCYEPLVTTLDHRVYTKDGYRQAGDLKPKDTIRFPVRRITNEHSSIQIIHQAPGGGHKEKEKRETASYLPTNYHVGYLLGLYLAEGTVCFNRRKSITMQASRITLAMDVDETERVSQAIRNALGEQTHIRPYRHKTSRTVVIEINSAGLARFIESNFGCNHSKTVPDWAWQCGEEFCKGILAGYLAGDGHTGKKGTAAVYASSVRLSILVQMRALTASLGYGWSSIHHRKAGTHYGRNCQEIWTMIWCGTVAVEVAKLRGKPSSQATRHYGYHWAYSEDKRWIDIQVKRVARGFSAEFYDLEVESPEHNFCTLSACVANSEYADWHPDYARDVIEEDLGNALAEDDPDMFAILESTAKGAGNYSYRLWNKNVELGEQAEWHPLFLPWFFERTRFIAPPNGWRAEAPELQMNERVQVDWLRCDNGDCEQYQERYTKTHDYEDTPCPTCGAGTLRAYSLKPGQMYWMQRKRKNAEKESESLKKLRQEMATTAEEAFQLSGIAIFGDGAQEYVNSTVRPPIKAGFIDRSGKFHGCNPRNPRLNSISNEYYDGCFCEGCDQDHTYGDENGESPFQVWKEPEKDVEYCIGADVSEGLGGEADYSCGFVLKVNKQGGADEQVAVFRSNLIDPVAFAQVLNYIGRAYNDAMMCIEVNRYDTCMTWIRFQLQYPNLYRWKHLDSINPLSNKLGWLTNVTTKPRLYQTLKRWLQFKLIVLYSRNLASELKTFTKDDYDERGAGSESGSYDDEAIACMIALYCAHEGDWDDSVGQMAVKRELTMEEAPWWMACGSCKLTWPARNAHDKQCPRCACRVISGTRNRSQVGDDNQLNPFYEGHTIDRQEASEYHVEVSREAVDTPEPDYYEV